MYKQLTIWWFSHSRFGRFTEFSNSSLVLRGHVELVLLTLNESCHGQARLSHFSSSDDGGPARAEAVAFLDDIAGDWAATVCVRLCPSQVHG